MRRGVVRMRDQPPGAHRRSWAHGLTSILAKTGGIAFSASLDWIDMAKTWVLDTETKGTGANVVPLEKVLKGPSRELELATVRLERPPRPDGEPEQAAGPLTFKVLDIRSGELLAEGIEARATVDLLEGVGSIVDVRIYVWMQKAARWRLLTLDEQRALWLFRGQTTAA